MGGLSRSDPAFRSSCPALAVRRTASLRSPIVPGIHVLTASSTTKTWMAGTSPAMTGLQRCAGDINLASMRHQHRQLGMGHDVARGAAEYQLPQPAAGEGALDQ